MCTPGIMQGSGTVPVLLGRARHANVFIPTVGTCIQ